MKKWPLQTLLPTVQSNMIIHGEIWFQQVFSPHPLSTSLLVLQPVCTSPFLFCPLLLISQRLLLFFHWLLLWFLLFPSFTAWYKPILHSNRCLPGYWRSWKCKRWNSWIFTACGREGWKDRVGLLGILNHPYHWITWCLINQYSSIVSDTKKKKMATMFFWCMPRHISSSSNLSKREH